MRVSHNILQGSPEWHALRSECFNASEASAAAGLSKYQTRDDLLCSKKTGFKPEVSKQLQNLFDRGHYAESSIRPYIESIVGQELYPVVVTMDIDGVRLLSSYDGLTVLDDIVFEHKLWSEGLAEQVRNNDLDEHYKLQLDQQLLVSGAEKAIFVTSDGTPEKCAYMWYLPDNERFKRLIGIWHQFAKDLETFVPTAKAEKTIAEPVEALPAINYQIDFSNGISINSNLEVFKQAAQELVERSKTKLVSDQDFENAKARVKQCETAEKNITSLIQRVLGELGDVNKFKEDMESIKEWIRQSRLNQDKQIKERLTARKAEIIAAGRKAVEDYTAVTNTNLGRVRLPAIGCDLEGALYKKSSFASMESAVNDAVAGFKINADKWSAHLIQNLNTFDQLADGYTELFRDLQQLCEKDTDSLKAIVKVRIDEFKVKEQERIAAEAKRIADAKIAEEAARVAAEAKRIADSEKVETPAFVGNQDFAPAASNDERSQFAPTASCVWFGEKQPNKIFTTTADELINIIAMHFGCHCEDAETAILRAFKEYLTV